MQPLRSPTEPPAKRLVLISADGCRADKLFEMFDNTKSYAPFLREVIATKGGSWGVSHTRVPTESRPGHIAIIAGFYEDVSAIFTGWKENPVDFDSVFNQSNHVWQLGSPDVVHIFGQKNRGQVDSYHYPASMEDFASSDPTSLDRWVFDKFDELLLQSKQNATLDRMLREDKVVFFLHLLGIDTSGHQFRPGGQGYLDNIAYVDAKVRELYEKLEAFYDHDGRTAYILTADHGMTSRGSHGDGDPECTRTPLVCWGSGVRAASSGTGHIIYDGSIEYDEEVRYVRERWLLPPEQRKDIRQADLAPLMASLLGIAFPVNNVGKLPIEYLAPTSDSALQLPAVDRFVVLNLFTNAKQIVAQYAKKASDKREQTFFYREFEPLSEEKLQRYIDEIDRLIETDADYNTAAVRCSQLIELARDGLLYYQKYDWVMLRGGVSLGYLSWMLFVLLSVYSIMMDKSKQQARSRQPIIIPSVFIAVSALLVGYLLIERSPIQYFVYLAFPVYFLYQSVILIRELSSSSNNNNSSSSSSNTSSSSGSNSRDGFSFAGLLHWKTILRAVVYLGAIEILVIGYFKREVFSIGFWILGPLGCLFPSILFDTQQQSSTSRESGGFKYPLSWRVMWLAACLSMSVFTRLSATYGSHLELVYLGAALCILFITGWRLMSTSSAGSKASTTEHILFATQVILNIIAAWLVFDTEQSLAQKTGLPLTNQILAWTASGLSLVLPFFSDASKSASFERRLHSVCLGFATPFILLSVNYEMLFYSCLCVVVTLWIQIEIQTRKHNNNSSSSSSSTSTTQTSLISSRDFNTGMLVIFLLNMTFFGTGNLATIASFEIASVYRFTTVFNPFFMMAILLFKLIAPMLIVSFALAVIILRGIDSGSGAGAGNNRLAILLIVIALSDVLTINFFFLVTDFGSWLEIGNSISRFAIANFMIIIVLLLFQLAHWLATVHIIGGGRRTTQRKKVE